MQLCWQIITLCILLREGLLCTVVLKLFPHQVISRKNIGKFNLGRWLTGSLAVTIRGGFAG